jgi:hypothetical protein
MLAVYAHKPAPRVRSPTGGTRAPGHEPFEQGSSTSGRTSSGRSRASCTTDSSSMAALRRSAHDRRAHAVRLARAGLGVARRGCAGDGRSDGTRRAPSPDGHFCAGGRTRLAGRGESRGVGKGRPGRPTAQAPPRVLRGRRAARRPRRARPPLLRGGRAGAVRPTGGGAQACGTTATCRGGWGRARRDRASAARSRAGRRRSPRARHFTRFDRSWRPCPPPRSVLTWRTGPMYRADCVPGVFVPDVATIRPCRSSAQHQRRRAAPAAACCRHAVAPVPVSSNVMSSGSSV